MQSIYIGTVGKATVNSDGAFKHYKKVAKYRNPENTKRLHNYNNIITAFYEKIATKLIESEGGVFLKNFGYFTIIRHPKRQIVRSPYKGGTEFLNLGTNNYFYSPMFIPIAKLKPLLQLWTMDRTFNRLNIKAPLHKALVAGKKYKTYLATLTSLYLLNSK